VKTDRLALRTRFGLALRSWRNRAQIALLDLRDALDRRVAAKAGPTVAERRSELIEFYDHFENFVEVLCDAAQYGEADRLVAAYASERTWLVERYATLRPILLGYLRKLEPEGPDAILGLLGQPNLGAFINADDGFMISRITLGREAISLYGEHLRQLGG
jgi:hypothetical protein